MIEKAVKILLAFAISVSILGLSYVWLFMEVYTLEMSRSEAIHALILTMTFRYTSIATSVMFWVFTLILFIPFTMFLLQKK